MLSQSRLIDDQPAQVRSVKFDASYAQINKQSSCCHCSIPLYVSTNPQITRPIFIRGSQPSSDTGLIYFPAPHDENDNLAAKTHTVNSHVSLE